MQIGTHAGRQSVRQLGECLHDLPPHGLVAERAAFGAREGVVNGRTRAKRREVRRKAARRHAVDARAAHDRAQRPREAVVGERLGETGVGVGIHIPPAEGSVNEPAALLHERENRGDILAPDAIERQYVIGVQSS